GITSQGRVTVLLGRGDGTFAPAAGLPAPSPVGVDPESVVAGDFNNDGFLDLAVANAGSNDVSVLLGKGDGTFRPEQRTAVGAFPGRVTAGDFDGDGRLDLAVANTFSNDVSVLLNQGGGQFAPAAPYGLPGQPMKSGFAEPETDLVARDFNGDGR